MSDLRDFYDLTTPPADRLLCAGRVIAALHARVAELERDAGRIPREPTEAMSAAGLAYYDYWHGNPHRRELVAGLFKSMYDAAVPGIPRERDAAVNLRDEATGEFLTCSATGNLCGTDTVASGYSCPCPDCRDYRRQRAVGRIASELRSPIDRAIAGDSHE